jgi:hypothetical protein
VAKNNPPVPNSNGRTNDVIKPPPLPIDDSLLVLLIIAILFGIYIIYNQTIEVKTILNRIFFRSFKGFD